MIRRRCEDARVPRLRIHAGRLRAVAALLALTILIAACGDDDQPAATSAPAGGGLAGTQWVLDTSALDVADAGDVVSFIAFERERVSGSDGCNRFSGSYEADGSALRFGVLAGTQMACIGSADAVAQQVNAALPKVRAYTIDGDTLRMQDAGGAVLLRWSANEPGVEGSWDVTSVLYDDAIRGVEQGTELTAVFGSDGTLTGSTGCNSFRGSYTLDGTRIKIGPLAATKKACASQQASEHPSRRPATSPRSSRRPRSTRRPAR
jgi:heat shock protein HslJ